MLSFLLGMLGTAALRRKGGAWCAGGVLFVAACQEVDHPPPPPNAPPASGDSGRDGGVVLPPGNPDAGPPPPSGSTPCGGQRLEAVVDRPNLYFVLDRSGSMSDRIGPSGPTKYTAARRAIGEVLAALGRRVRYGAMVFPASFDGEGCEGGTEIFPLTIGDPAVEDSGPNGPVLQSFLRQLASRPTGGATPTAAALRGAHDKLVTEPGRSYVVLATDGAPNCNPELRSCSSARCIPDIERLVASEEPLQTCGVDLSCCSSDFVDVAPAGWCMDDEASIAAVTALREANIPTYVVGMPGSEIYAGVLEALAAAGGTARAGSPAYYAVSDEAELTAALFEIGTGLPIGCEVTLDAAPEDRELVNVYFDREIVPRDPENGWDWGGESTVALRGGACASLRGGEVAEVELVYGCRTVVR